MRACPHCQSALETPLACSSCGRVLEAGEATPFELLGFAPAQALDRTELQQRVVRFSRLVHPDFFALAPAAERARAEANSARLNAAHALLADEIERADHLVRWLGGPDEQQERELPRAFLLEVLDWNETLESARAAPELDANRLALGALRTELEARRTSALANLTRLLTPLPERGAGALLAARQELNALRYLERALGEIRALRAGNPARR